PRVGPPGELLEAVAEARPLAGEAAVRFVGPGARREREILERAHPGSTGWAVRHDGLDAADLARAALSGRGPAAGLPSPGAAVHPLYVRPAQAEERVRRRAFASDPVRLR